MLVKENFLLIKNTACIMRQQLVATLVKTQNIQDLETMTLHLKIVRLSKNLMHWLNVMAIL